MFHSGTIYGQDRCVLSQWSGQIHFCMSAVLWCLLIGIFVVFCLLFSLRGLFSSFVLFYGDIPGTPYNMGAIRSCPSLTLHTVNLPTMQKERETVTLCLKDLFKIIFHLFSQEPGDFPVLKLEQYFISTYYFPLLIDYVHLIHSRALIEIRAQLC